MPSYDNQQPDMFPSSSHFLSPRKQSLNAVNNRRSTTSLRPSPSSSLAHHNDDDGDNYDDASNGQYSLAHELAVALMPEPSSGAKLLAEEFGIEYDEGAEGIDDPQLLQHNHTNEANAHSDNDRSSTPSFADELLFGTATANGDTLAASATQQSLDAQFHASREPTDDERDGFDPAFGGGGGMTRDRRKPRRDQPEQQDAMEILSQNLQSTDKFLAHLRNLDLDVISSPSSLSPSSFAYAQQQRQQSTQHQPALERLASDVLRRINETTRDRESQVRELLECEREFRKIAGQVGGSDVLSQLDELDSIEDLQEVSSSSPSTVKHANSLHRRDDSRPHLDSVLEEMETPTVTPRSNNKTSSQQHRRTRTQSANTTDWELDLHRQRFPADGDGDGYEDDYDQDQDGRSDFVSSPLSSPSKETFSSIPPPPPIVGPLTPEKTIAQLAHLRSFTTSLVASLTTISEQAQVNGAATTEAGRKIRALKNKLGGWRTEWDSAERSRVRIERWEAVGVWDMNDNGGGDGGSDDEEESAGGAISEGNDRDKAKERKRVDGRAFVQEHLREFELVLADAVMKTQAIMAS